MIIVCCYAEDIKNTTECLARECPRERLTNVISGDMLCVVEILCWSHKKTATAGAAVFLCDQFMIRFTRGFPIV